MKKLLPSFLLLFSSPVFAQADHFLLVGTYASPKSEGIHVYRFNNNDGSATALGHTRTSNPSYLAISPNQRFVYAVNEDEAGGVSAYSFDKKTGQLTLIIQRSSGGAHPCYIAVDKTGQWVVAGNYSSGTIALFKVHKNGGLDSAIQIIEHEGYSVNTDRQQGPHVHATVFSPDNKYLYVPDLGIDKVMIYAFDPKKGKLSPAPIPFEISEAGAGPRHFEFHPSGKWAYLMEELSGAVAVYAYKNGQLNLMQNITAIPGDYEGPVGSADIHVSADGKFLYASNRGESNTIAIFSINPKTGVLKPEGHHSTLGKTPRHFNFDPSGNFLLVANQNSDEIVVFKRDKKTGQLSDSGQRISLGKPVCIKWVKAD